MKVKELRNWMNSIIDKYREQIAKEDECNPDEITYSTMKLVRTLGHTSFYELDGDIYIVTEHDNVIGFVDSFSLDKPSVQSVEEFMEYYEDIYKSYSLV